jgi:hypothetical protein
LTKEKKVFKWFFDLHGLEAVLPTLLLLQLAPFA